MRFFKHIYVLILLLLPATAAAQHYNFTTVNRPAGLNWQQIKTDHFRIIFPDGEDSAAYHSAAILESQYEKASELTGGTLRNFPVILNNYSDLSNGFVTSFNFRSELDIGSQKGKGMNPQTGSWLETVLPHELVHAVHFNVQIPNEGKKASLPGLISLLSPDMARSFHGFPPVGIHEGLAVYHETEAVAPIGGRGNYTFFNNRLNSNFGSSGRWNMGQTLIPTVYTQPYNRHYIAGYSFTDWLHTNYGDDISRETIRFHYHNFFFGYGFALRKKTGKWPGQLYALYEADLAEEEQNRLSSISANTTEKSRIINTPYKGEEIHAPKWISENHLVFSGSFYNSNIGFYQYDIDRGEFSLIKEIFTVGDFNYEVEHGDELLFSSYKHHPLYAGNYIADILKVDLNSGKTRKLTENARVYAPTSNGSQIIGIQQDGANGNIVEISANGSLEILSSIDRAMPVSLKFNPANPDQLAVVMNKRGVQALWITSPNTLQNDLKDQPVLAFKNASIHDPEWHPDGTKILFTLDAPPAMNVYEFDLNSGEVFQLTNSLYNAFEASYSPDGQKIAYVVQAGDERKLAILDGDDFLNREVESNQLLTGEELQQKSERPFPGSELMDSLTSIKKEPYSRDLSWLRPRTIYPVMEEKAKTYQYGAGFASIDPLSAHSYSAEITGIQNRLWYDLTYTNKTFYPGFEVNVYSDPAFFATVNPNTNQLFSLMRQDRGLSLSFPFNYIFRGDTRLSSLYFSPEISAEQFRFYNLEPEPLSDFATRYKAGFYTQLNLGILNLRRDVQPSSGISFFGLYDRSLNEPEYSIQFPGGGRGFTRTNQWAAYYGAYGFVSPLRRWNQSLRLGLSFLQQSPSPIYSNDTIIPLGFKGTTFPNEISGQGFRNLARFSTRYTIPLFYPDTGGLTVPLYLSSIYLTTFTHTLTDMDSNDLAASARTILGAGFHVQFKVSNLLLDLGVGVAYEPSRGNTQFIFGQF